MHLLLSFLVVATSAQAMKPSKVEHVPNRPECFYPDRQPIPAIPVVADDCLPLLEQFRNFEKGEAVCHFSRDSAKGFALPHHVEHRTCGIAINLYRGGEEEQEDELSFLELSQALELIMDSCVRGGYSDRYGGFVKLGHNNRLYASIGGHELPKEDKGKGYYDTSEVPAPQRASRRKKPPRKEPKLPPKRTPV
jgi:hypothetical protein